jgi:hypothetical protein
MAVAMNALNTIEAMRRRRQGGGAAAPSLMASGAMPMPANPMTGLTPLPPPINVPTLPTPASPMAMPAQAAGPAMQGRNFMLDRGDGAPLLPYYSRTGAAPNIPGMTATDVGPAEGLMGGATAAAPAAASAPVEGLMGGAFLNDKGNFRGILPMLFGPSLSMDKNPGEFTGLVPGLFSGLSGIFGGE